MIPILRAAAVLALPLAAGFAAGPARAAAPARNASPPFVIRVLTEDIVVRPDGLSVQTIHAERTASNDAAAHQLAQLPIAFSPTLEELEVTEAYTLKADGRKLPVDPASIQTELLPGSPDVPMFDDRRRKVILFPDAAGGDTLIFTAVRRAKRPLFPGQFTTSFAFLRTDAVQQARVTVTAPAAMPLQVETHELEFRRAEADGAVTYEWRYANPEPLTEDLAAVSPYDRLPRLFVSSFADWDGFARAFAALAEPKEEVTPRVQALADRVTEGVSDRREQARLLYEWVSAHVRYVAIYLGFGGMEPHAADAVLASGYGDCKDHAVLFGALLKAKGIPSELVAINLGNAYTLSGPPTVAQPNHLITWLPEFGLYADTTAGVAPFGTLPPSEYGKPAVHVGGAAPVLRTTPVLPPGSETHLRTTEQLDAEGTISGETVTTARGAFAIPLRGLARVIQSRGGGQVAASLLKSRGWPGTGEFAFSPPEALAPDFAVTGSFRLEARPELLEGDSFHVPSGLHLMDPPGDGLMGRLNAGNLPKDAPTPCWSGTQTEDLTLRLPDKRRLAELPPPLSIHGAALDYESHWAQEDGSVQLHRSFTARPDQPLCTGAVRAEAVAALARIRRDQARRVSLATE